MDNQKKENNSNNVVGQLERSAKSIIEILPQRSADILAGRFGLFGNKKQTLEKIGQNYQITRERVRQIVADSFKRIKKNNPSSLDAIEEKIIFTINAKNGIINKKELLQKLKASDIQEENALDFLVECSSRIRQIETKNFLRPSLIVKNFSLEGVEKIEKQALDFFRKNNQTVQKNELVDYVSQGNKSLSRENIKNWLNVLDRIRKNNFSKWGIREWPEITPKNTRDKIYLVLKEIGKPLHFSEIASSIDEHGLSKKKSHPQTVHNELIKDKRFVLIGRGIYALAEWGYSKGTVKDVLKKILEDKGPLSKEEIFPEIMKVRKVKKATIMINLNNAKFFIKEKNLYRAVN